MKFKIFVVVWIWCLTGMVIYLDVNRQSLERDLAQCQADLTAATFCPLCHHPEDRIAVGTYAKTINRHFLINYSSNESDGSFNILRY